MIALLTAAALAIGLDEHPGARIPLDVTFHDTSGHSVQLARYFDRPVVLVLGYARCRMLCSVVLHGVADAVKRSTSIPGQDYTPLVISLDPRETVDEAARRDARLVADAGSRGPWPYLVGDDAAIHAIADALGFRYAWDPRTEQYAHPAVAFVLTRDGRIAEYLRGVTFDGLDGAVERAARGDITPSAAHDLLECFHFDPAARRYQDRIQLVFRIGATLIFLTLLCGVGLIARRHRK